MDLGADWALLKILEAVTRLYRSSEHEPTYFLQRLRLRLLQSFINVLKYAKYVESGQGTRWAFKDNRATPRQLIYTLGQKRKSPANAQNQWPILVEETISIFHTLTTRF